MQKFLFLAGTEIDIWRELEVRRRGSDANGMTGDESMSTHLVLIDDLGIGSDGSIFTAFS